MRPGKKPLPTATLKLHGRYREDKHGRRADSEPPHGSPVKPLMGEVESALWEQVVPDLKERGLVGESDSPELTRLCEIWGLYRAAYELARLDPCDKKLRAAVLGYAGEFGRVSARYGLSPADRASIKIDKSESRKGLAVRQKSE